MDKLFTLIFDIVVVVVIAFIAVMIYFGLRTETVISTMDTEITENFLSEMKEKGSMATRDYENYMYKLSLTGVLYEVLLEHSYKILEPEYRMRSIEEIIAAQKAAYTGENIYHYKDVITYIPGVTDPIDNSGLTMNTETNASILAKSTNTPSTGHVHTDACYDHKHIQPYGTMNMTNVPVNIIRYDTGSYLYNDSGSMIGYYDYGLTVSCGVCGNKLYSIYYDGGRGQWYPSYVYCRTYSNSTTYPYERTTTTTTTFPYENTPDWWATVKFKVSNEFYSFMGYGNSGAKMNFPWAGFPKWDSAGNLSYIPFTGCTNVSSTKHANPDACYPIGKKTKVHIQAGFSMDNSLFFYGDQEAQITVTCADCRRVIASMTLHRSNDLYPYATTESDDYIRTSISASFPGYDSNGSIKEFYSGANMYLGRRTAAQCAEFRATNLMAFSLLAAIQDTKDKIPWGTGGESYSGNTWWTTTTPIDFPLPGVLVDRPADINNPVAWAPYRGCPYCGTFGSAYTCGKSEATKCEKVIASIVPTHPIQAVFTGEALITTVIVTYMDGSTKVVIANTDFNSNTPIKNKTVPLSIADTYGNTKACTITVTVVSRTKSCSNGHTYNLRNDGSDPGCPFCKEYIRNIRVIEPSVTTLTITIGTSLFDNGVKILATYMDGHTEILSVGYEDNLDSHYLGTKMVTIGYKGATTQILVTTVCGKLTCDICGFIYDLYPDGTNPGCPRCISKTPVFTGNVLHYDAVNYTEDILENLYEDGIYKFNKDDSLIITVENKSSTMVRNLLGKILPNMTDKWIHIECNETIHSK